MKADQCPSIYDGLRCAKTTGHKKRTHQNGKRTWTDAETQRLDSPRP